PAHAASRPARCDAPPTPENATLSLHDALPISPHAVPAAQPHVPVEHTRPPVQALSQPPQCIALVIGSTHAPEHSIRPAGHAQVPDRKSTRLNSSHVKISYAVFCLKKKNCPPFE